VSGTEVLGGRVPDLNGPWLADRLLELGFELAHLTVCPDRPAEIGAQLRFLLADGVALVVTTGGLGPTDDDLTAEVVARVSDAPLETDAALEARIVAKLARFGRAGDAISESAAAAARKQARVPRGASVIEPVGTAPGFVIEPSAGSEPAIVVLPGPPAELQAMWPIAAGTVPVRRASAGAQALEIGVLRLFGVSESELTETLRIAAGTVDGLARLEVTTCQRRGELELAIRHGRSSAASVKGLRELIAERHGTSLFSLDGSSVDEQVAALLSGRRLAVAESCTGGLMAGRISERPGASGYLAGAIVAYADDAKTRLLGVAEELLASDGAVSAPVAAALADGALRRFGADTAIAITGIAGPGGGSATKPVGYVCWSAKLADGSALAHEALLPGGRAEIRDRATTVGMHLLRRLLDGQTGR